ncbi:unnamed protein product, partial [Nesidiocoris tenuis]
MERGRSTSTHARLRRVPRQPRARRAKYLAPSQNSARFEGSDYPRGNRRTSRTNVHSYFNVQDHSGRKGMKFVCVITPDS